MCVCVCACACFCVCVLHEKEFGENSWFYVGIRNKWGNFLSDGPMLKLSAIITSEVAEYDEFNVRS